MITYVFNIEKKTICNAKIKKISYYSIKISQCFYKISYYNVLGLFTKCFKCANCCQNMNREKYACNNFVIRNAIYTTIFFPLTMKTK